jgi:hypothetical protein
MVYNMKKLKSLLVGLATGKIQIQFGKDSDICRHN